mmetsp:Transcript_27890/g.64799  ORF Transcript_27890/g.64799 Transcript_27890/m.64799 type:complete len:377 (-) Transcript_27890:83-1213(-)
MKVIRWALALTLFHSTQHTADSLSVSAAAAALNSLRSRSKAAAAVLHTNTAGTSVTDALRARLGTKKLRKKTSKGLGDLPKHIDAETPFCNFVQNASHISAEVVDMLAHMAGKDDAHQGHDRERLSALFKDGKFHAGTCAVVSNSGVLLNHTYGADIDAADIVIRFNDAELSDPTLAAFVGTHDDIRILNNQIGMALKRGAMGMDPPGSPDALYVLQRFHEDMQNVMALQSGNSTIVADMLASTRDRHPEAHFVAGSDQVQSVSNEVMHSVFGENIHRSFHSERFLTTGFYGVMLAMSLCDKVDAYGFVQSVNSASAPYHYYGKMKVGSADNKQHHPTYDQEKHFWKMVSRNDDADLSDRTVLPGFRALSCARKTE